MAKTDALSSYMAEIVDIMQEVQLKIQRVKEIKSEMDKLFKPKVTTTTTTTTTKITCKCGCKINKSSWYTHIKTKKHEKLLNQKLNERGKKEVKKEENPKDEIK